MSDQYSGVYKTNRGGFFLNCLTIVILLATLVVGGVYAAVFLNPNIPYNPYPPPTLPPTLGAPTITPTPEIFLPPTWTPAPSRTPTPILAPTETPAPLPTDTPVPTEGSPEPSPTGPPFSLQSGSPGRRWAGLRPQRRAHSTTGCSLGGDHWRTSDQAGQLDRERQCPRPGRLCLQRVRPPYCQPRNPLDPTQRHGRDPAYQQGLPGHIRLL